MTHCPRHRIHSLGPCPACIAEWNQGVDRAADAYAMDRSTEAGLCITCTSPRARHHRECWPCIGARTN